MRKGRLRILGGTAGVLGAIVAVVCGTSTAQADVLCRTKAGVLTSRAKCKTRETAVVPSAIGLQGPEGPQGPAGPPGPQGLPAVGASGLRLLNGAGDEVGLVVEAAPAWCRILVRRGDEHVLIYVESDGTLERDSLASMFFDTASCDGAAYGAVDPERPVLGHILYGDEDGQGGWYVRASDASLRDAYIWYRPGGVGPRVCAKTDGPLPLAPIIHVTASDLGLVPPLRYAY